jgi:hypothetical protein
MLYVGTSPATSHSNAVRIETGQRFAHYRTGDVVFRTELILRWQPVADLKIPSNDLPEYLFIHSVGITPGNIFNGHGFLNECVSHLKDSTRDSGAVPRQSLPLGGL